MTNTPDTTAAKMLGGVYLFAMHVCIFMAWWSGLRDGSGPFTFGVLGALTLALLAIDCWMSYEVVSRRESRDE